MSQRTATVIKIALIALVEGVWYFGYIFGSLKIRAGCLRDADPSLLYKGPFVPGECGLGHYLPEVYQTSGLFVGAALILLVLGYIAFRKPTWH